MEKSELQKNVADHAECIKTINDSLLVVSETLIRMQVETSVHRQMFEKLADHAPFAGNKILDGYNEMYSAEWERRIIDLEKSNPALAARFDKDRPLIDPDGE